MLKSLKEIVFGRFVYLEESYRYLKKGKGRKNILIKIKDKIENFSCERFEKFFDVEYLSNLYFKDIKILRKAVLKCKKAIRMGYIAEKEIWLGTYYSEEIEQGDTSKVYIKWIDPYKEYGLFALEELREDCFIGEYTGLVRRHKSRLDKKNGYCFEYQIGYKSPFTIDAKYCGNYLRFINHSYKPNLSLFPAYYRGIIHIIMKTNRSVKKDEELTYDYGPNYWKKREDPISL